VPLFGIWIYVAFQWAMHPHSRNYYYAWAGAFSSSCVDGQNNCVADGEVYPECILFISARTILSSKVINSPATSLTYVGIFEAPFPVLLLSEMGFLIGEFWVRLSGIENGEFCLISTDWGMHPFSLTSLTSPTSSSSGSRRFYATSLWSSSLEMALVRKQPSVMSSLVFAEYFQLPIWLYFFDVAPQSSTPRECRRSLFYSLHNRPSCLLCRKSCTAVHPSNLVPLIPRRGEL